VGKLLWLRHSGEGRNPGTITFPLTALITVSQNTDLATPTFLLLDMDSGLRRNDGARKNRFKNPLVFLAPLAVLTNNYLAPLAVNSFGGSTRIQAAPGCANQSPVDTDAPR